jgi:hypothetical protein
MKNVGSMAFLRGRKAWACKMAEPLAIDVHTPLGFRVIRSEDYWVRITTIKHPAMRDRLEDVRQTLIAPDQVRWSVKDSNVLLVHRKVTPRCVCAVVKRTDDLGYLLTAYPADKIKQGEIVWTK